MRFCIVLAIAFGLAGPALATNSPPELRIVLRNLMTWLPGEYDNAAQVFFEREQKTPEKDIHIRIYRAYHRIDAPAVGDNVLLFEVRNGGKRTALDMAEFQVWILSVDADRKAVRMSPRRFVDEKKYAALLGQPDKFNGLTPADLKPGEGVAGCDILWRLRGDQIVGATVPGACKGVSRRTGQEMNFSWEFTQNENEQWISFAGRDAGGKIVFGREDQTEWRLGKARPFECFLSFREAGVPDQVNNGFLMHDRGDHYRWQITDAKGTRPVFMELIRGMWPSNSGRNYTDLLRLQVYQGTPDDPPEKWTLIGSALGSAETDRVGFASRGLSGRCKLFDPANPPPKAQ
ncbi:MAG: hypothetical protein FJX59_11990 [Alphaproteobacteria bacterium]|nr:hypothetical protein [Alphaproteobacteria bacterium]